MELPKTPSFRLEGKRALVAGASSGIGLAAAAALAEAGAHVVAAARREEALADLVAAITAVGGSAEALAMDIADLPDMQAKVAAHGPFDVLVNSAGLARHGPSLETRPEDFDAVVDVNQRGAYFLAQAVAKGLLSEGKPGSLITISSQMAVISGPERAVYSGTKHAVEGFTKGMAIEWGPMGIRVNTICPTFIRTAFTEKVFERPELVEWLEGKIKLGRLGVVEDIMGPVVFLASDASALVTGTALMVDGGWTAG